MTLRSRIIQRTAHPSTVAERAPIHQATGHKNGRHHGAQASEAAMLAPTTSTGRRSTSSANALPPEPTSTATLWDVPARLTLCAPPVARTNDAVASTETSEPARRRTLTARRRRPAVVSAPVDWSAVRAYSGA